MIYLLAVLIRIRYLYDAMPCPSVTRVKHDRVNYLGGRKLKRAGDCGAAVFVSCRQTTGTKAFAIKGGNEVRSVHVEDEARTA